MGRSLGDLFSAQLILMRAFEIDRKDPASTLAAAAGMSIESSEVLNILNKANRPWRPVEVNRRHLLEEIVDVLFYLIELLILSDITPEELFDLYTWKANINHARILDTFSKEERQEVLIKLRKDVKHPEESDLSPIEISTAWLLARGVLKYAIASEEFLTDEDYQFIFSPIHFVRRGDK